MYRLVVIDDEYIVVEGIKAMIERQKLEYEVVGCAYDGIHGLEVIQKCQPDLVITDIRIPGMDGLSVIETAKESCPNTAFVVISGYTEFEYAQKALRLGVMGYIDKPISMKKLNEVLENVEQSFFEARKEKDIYEQNRKCMEDLNEILEKSIQGMLEQNVEKFYQHTEDMLNRLQDIYSDFAELKREVYKYICVLCDIFQENRTDVSRSQLISYQEMEKCTGTKEVLEYAEKNLKDIGKYIEASRSGSKNGVILDLLGYLEQHYSEDICLNDLADRVSMSTAYLSVLFKSEVGMSYVKYLTNLRMEKAKKFLKEGRKVYEVSEMVGYHNYRHFTDTFKRVVGQTPQTYKMHIWGGADTEK